MRGALTAKEQGITNAGFVRMVIHKIDELYAAGEVDEIWITFPDPFPKDRHAKHRLTSPNFLTRYRAILKQGGLIHFKTDDTPLFEYTLEVLKELQITPEEINWDVHGNTDSHAHLRESEPTTKTSSLHRAEPLNTYDSVFHNASNPCT